MNISSLGEIAREAGGVIQTGPFGSQLHRSDYRDAGIPVIMPKDIVDNQISTATIARIDLQTADRLARHRVKPGDILIPRRGDLDRRLLIKEQQDGWLCGTGSMKVSIAGGPVVPEYLFYYLRLPQVVRRIEGVAIGATMLNLSAKALSTLTVEYPSTYVQRRIADILTAYDDLIANNQRRMELLEEAMHRLYREWFVYLRFPGHEHTPVVDGVPARWEATTTDAAFDFIGGGTPSRKVEQYWRDGQINWYTPSDLTKSSVMFEEVSSERISEQGLAKSSARLFPAYSVMMTSRATIGAIAINTTEACTNQGFISCIPNRRVPLHFLYCWLSANTHVFENYASGATFKEIPKRVFGRLEIIIPDSEVVHRFEDFVKPVANQILNLHRQNERLRVARDALLPRLMNGGLTV